MSIQSTEFVNTIVKAGAGAGKTYGLIQKIVQLVKEYTQENDQELPRFVVTTFTRKATQEVRERLLAKAMELRQTEPEFGLLFLKFLRTSGSLFISTIHGVLNQFLRQYGIAIGLDPDFNLVSSQESLLTETLHDLLTTEPELPSLVNKYGWGRIRQFFLDYHRNTLFNPSIEPVPEALFHDYWKSQIALLENSIFEIKPFLETLLTKSKSDSLRRFSEALNAIELNLRGPLDLWQQLQEVKKAHTNVPKSLGSLNNWTDEAKQLRQTIMTVLSEIAEDPWSVKENFENHQSEQRILAEIADRFSQQWTLHKIRRGEISLEDLELFSLYILRAFPEQTKAYSDLWHYWFIDEYQDTSPIQVEILKHLIGECPHYVVGDPQQSIYFFRGARSKVFNEKLCEFTEQGARVEVKTINRRSLTPTLHFINDLMDLVNPQQFTSMTSPDENQSDQKIVGHFYLVTDEEKEHLECLGKVVSKLLMSGIKPNEIAVLCRENSELTKVFKYFNELGLPSQVVSQGRFAEDREVRDALCLWRFLINPFDDSNLIEISRSPLFKIPDAQLLESARERDANLWESLRGLDHPTVSLFKRALADLNTKGHLEVWLHLLLSSTLFERCTELDPSGRKEGNLWKLITIFEEHYRKGTLNYTDPLGLVQETDASKEAEATSIRESHQIQLMTIHASKGLEFEHVIIPFLNHSQKKDALDFWDTDLDIRYWSTALMNPNTQKIHASFFSQKNAEEIHHLLAEESERLFYVAITRAKKGLYFFPVTKDDSDIPTGWARHLVTFINQGTGLFQSPKGTYDFEVEWGRDIAQMASTELRASAQSIQPIAVLSSMPLVATTSVSVTELIRQEEKGQTAAFPTKWNIGPITQGVKIHRWLQSYFLNRKINDLTLELRQFIETIDWPLNELFENAHPEWAFTLKLENKIIEGQIDLWGRDHNGHVWIIDYKTGSELYVEKAFQQMVVYAWALRKMDLLKIGESAHLVVCYPLARRSQKRTLTPHEIEALDF